MPPPSPLIPPLACSSPSTSSSTHLSDRLKSLESGPFVDAVHGLERWEDGEAATGDGSERRDVACCRNMVVLGGATC